MEKFAEKRQAFRHQLEVPIHFDEGSGKTRDISLTGVYFMTDRKLEAGQNLRMQMELAYVIPGKSLLIDCQGQVLRIEKRSTRYGVAAVIDEIHYLH